MKAFDRNFPHDEDIMKHLLLLINLDDSCERLERASSQLQKVALPFTRISAFDGRRTNPDDLPVYDREKAYNYLGRAMVGGEMGCYFSHLDCAHNFLKSDADICIVIEDDIQFEINFTEIIVEAVGWMNENGHADWEILNFGNQKLKISTPLKQLSAEQGKYSLHKAHYFPMTTTGIVWSRAGAKAFIEASLRIYAPVDNYLRHWQTRRDKGFSFHPPLVTTTGSASEIDTNGTGMRRKNKRALNYYFAKQKRLWIDKAIATKHKVMMRCLGQDR